MKEQSKKQLQEVILQTLSQYFEASGINQILLALYEGQGQVPVSVPSKVQNIIQNNTKKMSRVQQLKKKYGNQGMVFGEEEQLQIPQVGIEGTALVPSVRAKLNQNIDMLATGESILQDVQSLPSFLLKGLNKVRNNGIN